LVNLHRFVIAIRSPFGLFNKSLTLDDRVN